jgi:hypothetical protein
LKNCVRFDAELFHCHPAILTLEPINMRERFNGLYFWVQLVLQED